MNRQQLFHFIVEHLKCQLFMYFFIFKALFPMLNIINLFYFYFLVQAMASACKVPATFQSELTDSETVDECEQQFSEDQELEQIINGEICFKVYPSLNGMV